MLRASNALLFCSLLQSLIVSFMWFAAAEARKLREERAKSGNSGARVTAAVSFYIFDCIGSGAPWPALNANRMFALCSDFIIVVELVVNPCR